MVTINLPDLTQDQYERMILDQVTLNERMKLKLLEFHGQIEAMTGQIEALNEEVAKLKGEGKTRRRAAE